MSSLPVRARTLCVFRSISALLYLLVAIIFWTDAIFVKSENVRLALTTIVALLTTLYFAGIPRVRQTSLAVIVTCGIAFAVLGFLIGPYD